MSQARPSRSTAATDLRLRFQLVVIVLAGLAAAIVAAAITSGNVEGEGAALAAVARASIVAVPIGVGLYAWHSRPDDRFGRMLVVAGFAWFLTTFAESSDELLYSIGRVAGWLVEVGLVWLILAFPSGRLADAGRPAAAGGGAALVALLYLPTTFLDATFPRRARGRRAFRPVLTTPSAGLRAGLHGRRGGAPQGAVDDPAVLGHHRPRGQLVSRATPITRLTLIPR